MSNLNFIDIIILVIFFISILLGFGRGLVGELISLITLIAALVIATLFANPLARVFTSSSTVQNVVHQASTSGVNAAQHVSYVVVGISFALIFIGVLIVGAILGYIVNTAFQLGLMGFGNRFMGALFGLGRGFLINLVLIFLMQLSPFSSEPWWQNSKLVHAFQPSVKWLESMVSPSLDTFKSKVQQGIQNVNTRLFQIIHHGSWSSRWSRS